MLLVENNFEGTVHWVHFVCFAINFPWWFGKALIFVVFLAAVCGVFECPNQNLSSSLPAAYHLFRGLTYIQPRKPRRHTVTRILIGNELLLESIAAPKPTNNTGSRVSSMEPPRFLRQLRGFFRWGRSRGEGEHGQSERDHHGRGHGLCRTGIILLLMERILHHLVCIKPVNNGKNYLSTGAGFLPSTVVILHKISQWWLDCLILVSFLFLGTLLRKNLAGESCSRLQICPLYIFGNKATEGTCGSKYWFPRFGFDSGPNL